MTSTAIRFGVWAPVHGPRAALNDPDEPFDASWEHNQAVILEAEQLGFHSTLIAQHTVNPHLPDHDQLETWTAAAALAALTRRIEIIAAVKPFIFHPVFLAKMALQIENISKGRFGINLINAWNRIEFEKAGIPFGEHDARYEYGREWISVVSRLIAGESVTHRGQHFSITDYKLTPRDLHRARPLIYIGGESEPARSLAADHGDVWFINGQPLADVTALIADLRRRPRQGAPLRFGLSAFVIARATESEAHDAYARLVDLAAQDADVHALQRRNADPKTVMFQTMAKSVRVGTNGGTAAGLVGSYDQVSERILAFHKAGIELFMLQFQPLRAEMRRFAAEVVPRVRAAGQVAASPALSTV
ncbi:LLM class flavin-dependent oxidoreductase [Ancylobacter sp. WKF20]|uniref:LLM class flavin-dependent oxidoreductase n=1 Tax=Ancylobacter sp. WKF20 TaxID=3039801 RepID=UPI002434216B|nr:LLM class flavin-dependent oxidoreductase [Ancylobacter sp. WKF20]WGD28316.1 LLM class flavin-dependent oxidoreductase [Ancylobacter sp. WKF20]